MADGKMRRLSEYQEYPAEQMLSRAQAFNADMQRRRTVRDFSDQPVDRAVIEQCICAAGSAPSGANLQPWHFVVVSNDGIKKRIREAAEAEEQAFYQRRAPQDWLDALAELGTDEHKPFLQTAPYLIAVFVQKYARDAQGHKTKHYYPTESVGLACGLLITALHQAGLASLTHTPSPMGFLNDILGRPRETERPFLLLVVGYPATNAQVPDIRRKPLSDIASFLS